MAAHGWRSHRPLNVQVLQEYTDFDYYQLVRLGRRMLGDEHAPKTSEEADAPVAWDTLADNRRPWDRASGQAADARLKVRAERSSGFGGHEVSALGFTRDSDGEPEQITLNSANYCLDGVF